jgi:hypothetical protein
VWLARILRGVMRGDRYHNTNLDDIAAVIGYTPTRVIAGWFPNKNLYVPTQYRPGHPLEFLIGVSCLKRLVRAFAGQRIYVPTERQDRLVFRDREIAEAFTSGATDRVLADRYGLTLRRVEQLRRALTDNGIVDYSRLDEN